MNYFEFIKVNGQERLVNMAYVSQVLKLANGNAQFIMEYPYRNMDYINSDENYDEYVSRFKPTTPEPLCDEDIVMKNLPYIQKQKKQKKTTSKEVENLENALDAELEAEEKE